ncbi:MAG: nitrogen regulation protein NR(II) [Betaproteobacteria bacterium]|nr:nitrogen regulation protein NR(II) [Betaproteobacteria bacterium]
MTLAASCGLDLLATAVVLVDENLTVAYVNPAAENLFELSSKNMVGQALVRIFADDTVLASAIARARANNCSYTEHDFTLGAAGHTKLHLSCTVTPVEPDARSRREYALLLEFRHIEQQLRIAREERMRDESQANRELIRNLAHEIKNPLGGIRGAAQLLDRELERPALHEYTQVIIKEADRLQALMDRLLSPHRLPQIAELNIHDALERVRSLILAEYPHGIAIRRDYDASLPDLRGDRELILQALLNVVRNAAQAMQGRGEITLRTRVARQVTLARRLYRHALQIEVVDNGPGIPEALRDRVFYPLVSGKEGGTGLGLTLAQNFITQHHGTISFESAPGNTCFTILLPVDNGRDQG